MAREIATRTHWGGRRVVDGGSYRDGVPQRLSVWAAGAAAALENMGERIGEDEGGGRARGWGGRGGGGFGCGEGGATAGGHR